jgi:hypothetical protein
VQKPPQAVVLLAHHRHRLLHGPQPLEKPAKRWPMSWETLRERRFGGLETMR